VKDKELLERIQHRFTRMIPRIKDLPYLNDFNDNLWTLEGRRVRADLIEVFKMINDLTNVKFEVFFKFDTNYRTRGHARKLKKNRFNRDPRRHFYTERIINAWNKLDNQTVGPIGFLAEQLQVELGRLRRSGKMGLLLN